jgi:tetratricopeptide (TPR) repeat protein
MKQVIVVTILFAFAMASVNAQWSILNKEADSIVLKGAAHIYNMEFNEAEQCFRDVQSKFPEHPAGYFLAAMVDWWKILVDKPRATLYKTAFLSNIQRTIDLCDSLLLRNSGNINALFFKAGSLGYRGRFYVEDQSWLSAVKDGSSAYDLLVECLKVAPNNSDIALGTGIYNYFAQAIPEKYPIIKPLMLFMPSGDTTIGLLQLKSAASKARYVSVEAKTVLMQIYYIFTNRPYDCLPVIEDLYNSYPNNPYFKKYYARTLVRVGSWRKFEQIWREILIDCINKVYGYNNDLAREAMYYIGMALQNRGEYTDALRYYWKCNEGCRALDKDKPSSYMSMTNLNIGKIYDKQGRRALALERYKDVLAMPNFNTTHEQAKRYISKPFE